MVDRYLVVDFSQLNIKVKKKDKTGCWILDYTPSLSNLVFPKHFTEKIKTYFQKDPNREFDKLDIPNHVLILGLSGCGKWTIIRGIINHYYGIDLDNTTLSRSEEELKPDGSVAKENSYEFIKYYNTHSNLIYYVNIGALKAKDIKIFIEFLINNVKIKTTRKILIIRRIDLLETQYLNILAFILEKHYRRILLLATSHNLSHITNSKIKALSYHINMKHMTKAEFDRVNSKLSKKYNYKLCDTIAYKYYTENIYNLRNTLLQIQKHTQKTNKYEVPYQKQIAINLLNIIATKSYENYMLLREKLYSTLSIGISPRCLLQNTLKIILSSSRITDKTKHKTIVLAGKTDHSLCTADRDIFPMEQFYAELMDILT